MQPLFEWLSSHTYLLLFIVVLGGALLGKASIRGFGLGIAASTVVVAMALSATAQGAGVSMGVDEYTQSLFVALFMYGLGLGIGPSLHHSLRGDGLKLAGLATLCSILGLVLALAFARTWDLPPGAAGGILAGAMTVPAALGPAQEALKHSATALPPGVRHADVVGMIGLSYALTCLWGALGILLACKYLPGWWGVDVAAEARRHEAQLGVANLDEAGLSGYQPLSIRAYRLTNDALTGWTVKRFAQDYPHYSVLNVLRPEPARRAVEVARQLTIVRDADATSPVIAATAGMLPPTQYAKLGAFEDLALRQGDIITVGAQGGQQPRNAAIIGPEISDPAATNVPLDTARILVTQAGMEGRKLSELRGSGLAGQVAIQRVERGGVPIPLGLLLKLERFDVLFVIGVKSGVDRLAAMAGQIVRPSVTAELMTLAAGMILGLGIGSIELAVGGASVGPGNAIGLLISGILVSTLAARVLPGAAMGSARNLLAELGLVVFLAMTGINAGAGLAAQVSGELVTKILVVGFFVGTLPPVIAWAVGLHLMKLNPAILVGAVAGARAHPDPAREAAKTIGSDVPWIGFPVAYAVSVLLLALSGYVAMIVSR